MKWNILWALLIALLAGLVFFQYTQTENLQQQLLNQSQELTAIEDTYRSGINSIQVALDEYTSGVAVETLALEKEIASQQQSFESKISDIERKKEISEQVINTANQDLVNNLETLTEKIFDLESNTNRELSDKWDDIIIELSCDFDKHDRSYGSGVYFGPNSALNFGAGNDHIVLTNSHVLEEDGDVPTDCKMSFNTGDSIVVDNTAEEDEFSVSPYSFLGDLDAGFISLPEERFISDLSTNGVQYDLCSISPQTGDEILILGYPRIGSQEGVTLTEGIISGRDNEYFITSAKISRGNSGGAAISVKNDCYFGIPTLVKADEVESLGRILDIKTLFE